MRTSRTWLFKIGLLFLSVLSSCTSVGHLEPTKLPISDSFPSLPFPPGTKGTAMIEADGAVSIHVEYPDKTVKDYRVEGGKPDADSEALSVGSVDDSSTLNARVIDGAPIGRLNLLAGSIGLTMHVPEGIAVDRKGNIFLSDTGMGVIRRIASDGTAAVLAGLYKPGASGDKVGEAAFFTPKGIAVTDSGAIYIADTRAQIIRKLVSTGEVTTIAGSGKEGYSDGLGTATQFNWPTGVAVAPDRTVYVTDTQNNMIRRILPNGKVDTFAGGGGAGFKDGSGAQAQFSGPTGIAIDGEHNLYVADAGNKAIRKIDHKSNVTTIIAPPDVVGHTAVQAGIAVHPHAIAVSRDGLVYFMGADDRIGVMSKDGRLKFISWKRPDNSKGLSGTSNYFGMSVDESHNVYLLDWADDSVQKITPTGEVVKIAATGRIGTIDGRGGEARFDGLKGITADEHGNLYVTGGQNGSVRKITADGSVTTLAGGTKVGFANGVGKAAQLHFPTAVAVDRHGQIFVVDSFNHSIRMIWRNGNVTTIAGGARIFQGSGQNTQPVVGAADGVRAAAQFNSPKGIAIDESRGIYVADTGNKLIRKYTFDGQVTTLAGGRNRRGGASDRGYRDGFGEDARFSDPDHLAIDGNGNLYVTDNNSIRKITPDGNVSTFAGGVRNHAASRDSRDWFVKRGYVDGPGKSALFGALGGIAVDRQGNVFVLDSGNRAIRKITADGTVTSLHVEGNGPDTVVGTTNGSIGLATGIAVLPSGQLAIATDTAVVVTEKNQW